MLVFGIWLVMNLIYENAWKIDLGVANTIISWVCGLGDLIFRILTPLIVYAMACPRGASFPERVVASMIPSIGWAAHELFLATGVFPLGRLFTMASVRPFYLFSVL